MQQPYLADICREARGDHPNRTDIMTILVDLRRWRIEADPMRLDRSDAPCAPQPSHAPATPDGAEIILFPRIGRALLERPRKSLKRRFAKRIRTDAITV